MVNLTSTANQQHGYYYYGISDILQLLPEKEREREHLANYIPSVWPVATGEREEMRFEEQQQHLLLSSTVSYCCQPARLTNLPPSFPRSFLCQHHMLLPLLFSFFFFVMEKS